MVNKALTSCRNTNTKVQIIGNRIIVHIHIGTRSNQRDPFWCLLQWEIVSRVCIVCMCVHVYCFSSIPNKLHTTSASSHAFQPKDDFFLIDFKYRQLFYALLSIARRDFFLSLRSFFLSFSRIHTTHLSLAVSPFRTVLSHPFIRNRAWSLPFLYQSSRDFFILHVFLSTHSRVLSRPFLFLSFRTLDLFFPDSYAQKHCSALSRMLRYLYICICIYIYKNTKNNLQNDIISILHASFIFVSHICYFFFSSFCFFVPLRRFYVCVLCVSVCVCECFIFRIENDPNARKNVKKRLLKTLPRTWSLFYHFVIFVFLFN